MEKVILSWAEITFACQAGIMRHIVNSKCNKNQGRPISEKSTLFDQHAMGALAEYAVAKLLNLHWEPHTPDICGGDLGGEEQIEVRWTPWINGRLLIQKKEEDLSRRFILVTGDLECRNQNNQVVLNVPGWLIGSDGQRSKWLWTPPDDGRECYFVPQRFLHKVHELKFRRENGTEMDY